MSVLSEIREERRRDRVMEAQIRQVEADRQAARRREDQAAAEALAADRRRERRELRAARLAKLPDLGMSALWATMIVLPITLAWQAQAAFALTTLHIPGPWNHLFPASVETGAWLCAFEAHRRIRSGRAAGSLPRWMWVLAGIAAAINATHGVRDGGLPAGLALGALSLLGVLLHSIRQGLDAVEAAGHGALRAGLRLWRYVRYPRLSLAAVSIRAARELDAVAAWRLAWEDRYGVGPESSRRERRLARLVVRREMREARTAARDGEITIVAGRIHQGFAPSVQAYVDAERQAAMEQAQRATEQAQAVVQGAHDALMAAGMVFGPDALTAAEPVDGRSEQRDLSPRAAALLPAFREAIESGQVPPNPGVKQIRAWAKEQRGESLGVPAAQELRDAVASLHVVDAETARAAS